MQQNILVPDTTLGRSNLSVSKLGLAGSYGIDADSTERAFHELGVRYFFITTGMSGAVEGVRRLIKAGHRDRMIIAAGASVPTGFGVRGAVDKALKAFGVDYIDVFHLFWVQAHWYVTGGTWPAMRAAKESGKVKALAVSIHDRPMARQLVDELSLDALMIRYNAAHRGAEKDIFDSLDAKDRPGIIAYTATRWGKLLKPMKGLGPMSAGECYRFAISHSKVDVVLTGPANYAELEANAAAICQGPLSPSRLAEVKSFGDVVRGTPGGSLVFGGV